MKSLVLLVDLKVSTITGAGEKKYYNKDINNKHQNHKVLEQLNLASRTSI